LVCVNCSAIPDSLTESELFGAEKGAFTGAIQRQDGQIHHAHCGTLLLDEIGDMSLLSQAKILRVVEGKEVQRLGSGRPEPVDVRILAATHWDLQELVAARQFRADLFFRLNVLTLEMPPLRQRVQDISSLVEGFIREFNLSYDRDIHGVAPAGMRELMEYHWPGNIRELRNVIERAFIVARSQTITAEDLRRPDHYITQGPHAQPTRVTRSFSLPTVATSSEPDQLLSALHVTHWNKSEAAKLLHWSRMTVYRKIAKYNLPNRKPAASDDSFDQDAAGERARAASAGQV
jgi:two-component system response regulator HydG/two-component system response regulator AtoC